MYQVSGIQHAIPRAYEEKMQFLLARWTNSELHALFSSYALANTKPLSVLYRHGMCSYRAPLTHPNDGVQLSGGDLLGPLHGSCHLLLMLLGEERDHLSRDRIQSLSDLRLCV